MLPPGSEPTPEALPLRRANPWWIPRFLGRAPPLDPRLMRVLALVALALLFEQYDLALLTLALRFIAEDLGVAEAQLGGYLGVIRLGALPALALVALADRIGRRRSFLVAVVGMSVGTGLSAFCVTAEQFVVLQMVTRVFLLAGQAIAVVIVTEEFPAEHRGWGIGILGALAAAGGGVAGLVFALIEWLPGGWRALYALGAVPLLLIPFLRRNLRETRRFEQHDARRRARGGDGGGLRAWLHPLSSLVRSYPGRALGVGVVGALLAAGVASVFQFTAYFVLDVHGWTPGQLTAMFVLGGAVGILGNVAAGVLGDRIGRRSVGLLFMALFPVAAWLFYHGPGWSLPMGWIAIVFCSSAGGVVVRAFATELFPTSQRGTASGGLSMVEALGAAAGLGLVGFGTASLGLANVISIVAVGTLLAGAVLLLLPETGRRELESISHEEEE